MQAAKCTQSALCFEISDAHKYLLAYCTQVEASNCGMGTAGAKAFGDVLRVNKTLQHLNVSNNSFGKVQKGEQVKLKSSGEMCTVTQTPDSDNEVKVIRADGSSSGYMKWNLFQWNNEVPAFCAGLATSSSLLSVSDSMWCNAMMRWPWLTFLT